MLDVVDVVVVVFFLPQLGSCWKAGGDGEEEELNRDLHDNDLIIQTTMMDDDKTVAEPIG